MAKGRGPIKRAVALGARSGGEARPVDPGNGPAAARPCARAMAVAATLPPRGGSRRAVTTRGTPGDMKAQRRTGRFTDTVPIMLPLSATSKSGR